MYCQLILYIVLLYFDLQGVTLNITIHHVKKVPDADTFFL